MSKAEKKPKEGNHQAPANATSESTPYYVPRLKAFRSVKDLTHEDRESIADNLFGPGDPKARKELIQQLKKLAGDGAGKVSGPIEDGDTVSAPDQGDATDDGGAT